MKLVNLRGLIQLVNGCTKPESLPFKSWVSEVIATVQRDGSYSLEPSPAQTPATGTPAYVMPQEVADAIVRLEVRNIQADEMLAAFQEEQTVLLRQISRSQSAIVRSQSTIAEALQDIAQSLRSRKASYRLEEIATRTGLSVARVHDCLRTLLKRGGMRQRGCAADGAPIYVLP